MPTIGLAEIVTILAVLGIPAALIVGWMVIFRKSMKRP